MRTCTAVIGKCKDRGFHVGYLLSLIGACTQAENLDKLYEKLIHVGIGRRINEHVSLEIGYKMSYSFLPQREDFVRHIIRMETSIKLQSMINW